MYPSRYPIRPVQNLNGKIMNYFCIIVLVLVAPLLFESRPDTQASSPKSAQSFRPPAPHLSTAEKIALDSCEKQKQDAKTEYQQATQQEQTIMVEFSAEHPGYHLSGSNFAVEPDAPKAARPPLPAAK